MRKQKKRTMYATQCSYVYNTIIIHLFVQGLSYEVPYKVSTMHSGDFGNEMVSFATIIVCIFIVAT